MKSTENLDKNEIKAVNLLLESFSKKSKYKIDLDKLLEKWESFIKNVEEGYSDSIYEYTNDLSTRDLINRLMESDLSSSIKSKLASIIEELDQRFERATYKIESSLIPNKSKDIKWWFRIPNKISDDFEDDLKCENIIK